MQVVTYVKPSNHPFLLPHLQRLRSSIRDLISVSMLLYIFFFTKYATLLEKTLGTTDANN